MSSFIHRWERNVNGWSTGIETTMLEFLTNSCLKICTLVEAVSAGKLSLWLAQLLPNIGFGEWLLLFFRPDTGRRVTSPVHWNICHSIEFTHRGTFRILDTSVWDPPHYSIPIILPFQNMSIWHLSAILNFCSFNYFFLSFNSFIDRRSFRSFK